MWIGVTIYPDEAYSPYEMAQNRRDFDTSYGGQISDKIFTALLTKNRPVDHAGLRRSTVILYWAFKPCILTLSPVNNRLKTDSANLPSNFYDFQKSKLEQSL